MFDICFQHTLLKLKKEEKYKVALTLVSKETIQQLNKEYRDIDRPTDVLTFAFDEADPLSFDGVTDLGNIIICVDVAIDQAKSFKHPVERELSFLFIHGLLHSFGYEHHRSEEEANLMFSLQNDILNFLPIDFYTDFKKVKGMLKDAQSQSISPYSKFRVGAVILTKDKKYHIGFNIENAAYGDCMCAERVCIYHTYALGYKKDDILSISLITDSHNVGYPCGSCRQVMSELLNPYCKVHIYNYDFSKATHTDVFELLPFAFAKEDME